MRRTRGSAVRIPLLTAVLALAGPVSGHIGSPNVFYQGDAGPYPVLVSIRPPGVIPGLAEISVRVEAGGPVEVTVLPVHSSAGKAGAPPPDEAVPVRGAENLYSATLWLMETGAYSVFVEVSGAAGSGTAIVPVNAIATRRLDMPLFLGALLLALGGLLFAGLLAIVGAAARESHLSPGVEPGAGDRHRGRVAMVVAALLFVVALWGGREWWLEVDRNFRSNRLYRPLEVAASARVEGAQRILRLEIDPNEWRDWTPIVPDHGKLMHMFLLRESELDAFAHIHPVRRGPNAFEVAVPPFRGGRYIVYADVTHESGFAQTLTAVVDVPAAPPPGSGAGPVYLEPDADDSWHVLSTPGPAPAPRDPGDLVSPLDDVYVMVWKGATEIAARREALLEFRVLDTAGSPARLEPYMGMLSHAAIRRDDGSVFAHLHPVGTISMASQQLFAERGGAGAAATGAPGPDPHAHHAMGHSPDGSPDGPPAGGRVTFPYEFPESGGYRVWVQVKVEGRVLTGVFDVEVGERP